MNRAILIGNVGKDPEIRRTQAGDPIANFSIATSERWKDKASGEQKESTEWHNIVVFNDNIAKIVEQYVSKGSKVGVEGKIVSRKYTDKEGVERKVTEIVIGRFDGKLHLLSGKNDGGSSNRSEHDYGDTRTRSAGGGGASSAPAPLDDDIPF